jgi:hypothetical protein
LAIKIESLDPDVDHSERIMALEQQLGMEAPITARFNDAEKLTIDQVAKRMRLSMSSLVRMAVLEWIENRLPEYNKLYYRNLIKMTRSE